MAEAGGPAVKALQALWADACGRCGRRRQAGVDSMALSALRRGAVQDHEKIRTRDTDALAQRAAKRRCGAARRGGAVCVCVCVCLGGGLLGGVDVVRHLAYAARTPGVCVCERERERKREREREDPCRAGMTSRRGLRGREGAGREAIKEIRYKRAVR